MMELPGKLCGVGRRPPLERIPQAGPHNVGVAESACNRVWPVALGIVFPLPASLVTPVAHV